jgi:hypothetical protein
MRPQAMSLGELMAKKPRHGIPIMPVKFGRDLGQQHITGAPPCFSDQEQWRDYLAQAAHSWRGEGPRPFNGTRVNPDFNFCADCPSSWARQHQRTGNCQPDFLKTCLTKTKQN